MICKNNMFIPQEKTIRAYKYYYKIIESNIKPSRIEQDEEIMSTKLLSRHTNQLLLIEQIHMT